MVADQDRQPTSKSSASPTPSAEEMQQRLLLFEEFLRWRELMLQAHADPKIDQASEGPPIDGSADGQDLAPALSDAAASPMRSNIDPLQQLRTVQKTLLRHPVALQAAFRALASEGRRFALTDEGREWKARLQAGPHLERIRTLWESLSLSLLDDDDEALLPSAFLELFLQSAVSNDLEDLATDLGLPFIPQVGTNGQAQDDHS